jgi:hypothetical protein
MRKQLVTFDQAKPAKRQHKKPCQDCPFARASIRGWLGPYTAEEWLRIVHGEGKVECHTKIGPQCAGAAIYRGNVCKDPRDKTLLTLPRDTRLVFKGPQEFIEHHTGKKPESIDWNLVMYGIATKRATQREPHEESHLQVPAFYCGWVPARD